MMEFLGIKQKFRYRRHEKVPGLNPSSVASSLRSVLFIVFLFNSAINVVALVHVRYHDEECNS